MAVTLDQAREHLEFDDTDHDQDDQLQFYVDAANEWMATAVTTLEPKPVQMGTLELIRIAWKAHRGPAAGDLEGDELGGRGFLGFAIPNSVREWIEPWAVGEISGGSPMGSFPTDDGYDCWPDPTRARSFIWQF